MPRAPTSPAGIFGVHSGIVVDVKDPDGQGRVKVMLPWSEQPGAARFEAWARLAVPMAGNNRGMWFIPDVDDEVVVAFEGGDARRPIVIGALWNGRDTPPEAMDAAGNNDRKVIRSRSGVTITLDDRSGAERFEMRTPGGQTLVLQDGPGVVTVEDSNGNSIALSATGVKIQASARVDVTGSIVNVSAGVVQIDAGMAKFSGTVQCDTLIANAVVASSYTPGAGNVW